MIRLSKVQIYSIFFNLSRVLIRWLPIPLSHLTSVPGSIPNCSAIFLKLNPFFILYWQSKDIQTFCRLDSASEDLLKLAITKLGLSARAYDRILKVGRSIAELASSSDIKPEHVPPKKWRAGSEAIQYKSLDRSAEGGLWQA
jgi:hypothetical protein